MSSPTRDDYMHHNPGPPRITLTSKEKQVAKAVANAKRNTEKKSPAKGTKTNPNALGNYMAAIELDAGWHQSFFVERYNTDTKLWEWQSSSPTQKKAEAEIKSFKSDAAAGWVISKENEWRNENTNNQQERQIVQFRVTAKTTDKELEEHKTQLTEYRERLKANPPAVMPKFKKKDAPEVKFRVVVRTIHIEEKVAK